MIQQSTTLRCAMTSRDMLLGAYWAGRVWTGRGDGTAGAGDPGAHGGARGGWGWLAAAQPMFTQVPEVVVAVDFGRIRFHAL
jgi:hypothetical protein